MYKEELITIGFSEGEADIYVYLLKNGQKSAGDIIDGTGLKRGNTYNILETLVSKHLILQQEKNKVAHFHVENPRALLDYIDQKKADLDNKKTMTEALLPSLISTYQLTTNKPVVSYYEGKEGIQKVIDDSLTANTEVLQYMDYDEIKINLESIAKNYLKERVAKNLNKKILSLDGPLARDYYKEEKPLTEVRFIERGNSCFDVSMHIYDNKVSYFSFANDKKIGVIIEDSNIADMHRKLFLNLFNRS